MLEIRELWAEHLKITNLEVRAGGANKCARAVCMGGAVAEAWLYADAFCS